MTFCGPPEREGLRDEYIGCGYVLDPNGRYIYIFMTSEKCRFVTKNFEYFFEFLVLESIYICLKDKA